MSNKHNSDDILVKFSDVTKQYGNLIVLDKLNLEIKKNEMVSIIGPSGSGKTTVLRVLMTLEKIDQGIIHLDGEPLTHMDVNGNLLEANEKYLSNEMRIVIRRSGTESCIRIMVEAKTNDIVNNASNDIKEFIKEKINILL